MAGLEDSESIADRQENEFQALEAIFVDDCHDLRVGDAWKIHRPPEFRLTLRPQESMHGTEAHVVVDLCVKCSLTYPEEVPELKLENARGISNQQLAVLKEELDARARTLVGEVMILDLAQYIQDFLHKHNKPPPESFYVQMLLNKKKQEEQLAKEQQKRIDLRKKKEEKERQQIEDEIQKRKEALRLETRMRKEQAKQGGYERQRSSSSEPSTPSTDSVTVTPIPKDTEQRARASVSPDTRTPKGTDDLIRDCGSYQKVGRRRHEHSLVIVIGHFLSPRRTSTPMSTRESSEDKDSERGCQDHKGSVVLKFNTKVEKTIHRGKCLGHSTRGSTVYIGMDTCSGDLVTISEWVLKWRHANRKLDVDEKKQDDQHAAQYMKQVASIEQELLSLLRLKHRNLIHYLALQYQQHSGNIIVNVLMEHAGGSSLEWQLKSKFAVQTDLLRHYTMELLEALAYLHNKAVVHKDLRASSVFVDTTGRICLGDYSLDKRLFNLYASVESTRPGVHFTDDRPSTIGRGGKKGDIYRLGILLLSLAQGQQVSDTIPEIPTTLPADLHDFVTKCLMKDERQRWSAHELLEHNFVKTPMTVAVSSPEQPNTAQQNNGEAEEPDSPEQDIPFVPSSDASGHSRLKNEFEILKWLGKGGFGDVIKVRNKLDGRLYAIKRIPLNPRSKQFTRKITREVKLLSRLNHENVVRYYNSWIETSEEPAVSDTSSSLVSTSPSKSSAVSNLGVKAVENIKKDVQKLKNSLGLEEDNIESMAPARVDGSVEWSISVTHSSVKAQQASSDEEEDEEDVFGTSFLPHCDDSDDEDDDGIVFQHESNFSTWSDTDPDISGPTSVLFPPHLKKTRTLICSGGNDHYEQTENKTKGKITYESKDPKSSEANKDSSMDDTIPKLQFLYIQMEFCEKSTLRNCMDAGLYEDVDRVWRLFREIIEGLAHIHEQGMIHRDLKPVNIFLDSNDHVKIGDFGLATTDIITKQQTSLVDMTSNPSLTLDLNRSYSRSDSLGDGSLTGKVGTALYVSPEMMDTTTRMHYNQKVDIYSLGIIFFEMCYRSLATGMERVQVLTNLRKPSIDLPEDFDEIEMPHQAYIIRWLLDHDPHKRPSSQQLLQSEYLPPAQMEEAELNEVLRSTISDPHSKSYKSMIQAIMSQPISPATDFTYDIDLHKGSFSMDTALKHKIVQEKLAKIFSKHGAVKVTTPLLMPKSLLYELCDQVTCFMDRSGGPVTLPFDLRVPFARYIARNNISSLKRYSIGRVYREKRLLGLHPRELTECAFDIVTSGPAGLVPDAEVIHVVSEIINDFPALQNRNYYLRINHTSLLKAVLIHCGIPEEKHKDVYAILDTKTEKQTKSQIQTRLCSLSLSDETVALLYTFMESEGPYGKVASTLRCITKTKGQAGSLAKKGLHEIEAVLAHVDVLGCKLRPIVALGLVYNVQFFSGILFQVMCHHADVRKKNIMDVLAAGGRYDDLVSSFHKPSLGLSTPQCAIGVSVAYDKLVAALTEDKEFQLPSNYDVLLCSLGHKPMVREKLAVARDLWSAGLSVNILHDNSQTLEDMQDLCRQTGVAHIVILKDTDTGIVKVRSFDKDKLVEKKMSSAEVADYLLQKLQAGKIETSDSSRSTNRPTGVPPSGSCEQCSGSNNSSGMASFYINFMVQDKLASNSKRKYEFQIFSSISPVLSILSKNCYVEILAVELPLQVLKTMATNLQLEVDEAAFERSIGPIMDKHARHRKYLTKILDHIHDLKFDNDSDKGTVVVLYSLKDDNYTVLL